MVLLSSSLAWAHGDHASAQAKDKSHKADDKGKKTNKKKVEMFSECGKPESGCDCHGSDGHKHDEKATDKKSSPEGK